MYKLEVPEKDIKTVIISVFYSVQKLSRDVEDVHNSQIKFLEVKITMTEIKKTLAGNVLKTDYIEGEKINEYIKYCNINHKIKHS